MRCINKCIIVCFGLAINSDMISVIILCIVHKIAILPIK